jgi:Flp pilus assembly protein TadD
MRKLLALLAFTYWVGFSSAAFGGSDEALERLHAGKESLALGRWEAAVREFQEAAALDPKSAAPHLNLGAAYERANRPDEAISAYRKAVELEPKNFYANNNLGVLLDQKGAPELAIAAFENALKSEPGSAMAQKNLETAKKNRAVLKEREAEVARAEKDAQAKPGDPRLAYQVARVHAFQNNKEAALQWLQKAMQLGFKDPNYVKSDPAFVKLRTERELELLLLKK